VKVIVIGCGRVGAALALALDREGWDVVVVDEDEEALERLGDWRKRFVVGHGIDVDVLQRAGIAEADALVAATLRYSVPSVAARIHDPARADFYSGREIEIVSPARSAIADLTRWALAAGRVNA